METLIGLQSVPSPDILSRTEKLEGKRCRPTLRLPVPNLEETALKYLTSLRPLILASDLQASENAVAEFIQPGGIGEELQRRLLARSRNPQIVNWLSEWWDERYLRDRTPLAPYVSFFVSCRDDLPHLTRSVLAARLAKAVLGFKRMVEDQNPNVDAFGGGNFCTRRYAYLFNSCRIPRLEEDMFEKFPGEENSFFAVVRRGRFWKVMHGVDGEELNEQELAKMFDVIYGRDSDEKDGESTGIGILTTENRDSWAETHAHLLALSPTNIHSLHAIQSSSFLINLDTAEPSSLAQLAHQYFHGSPKDFNNRWYDKPVQFIVTDNKRLGFVGEHSMLDGAQGLGMNAFVQKYFSDHQNRHGTEVIRNNLPGPVEIDFTLNTELHEAISAAQMHFQRNVGEIDLAVLPYTGYGQRFIKKMGFSPDAYVQMLIQLAYFQMTGALRPVYEAASTIMFQDGRTEGVRSVSSESLAFCKAMMTLPRDDGYCIFLLHNAVQKHTKSFFEASTGQGIERYLWALHKLLKPGEEIPAIFKDPAWERSRRWVVCTSPIKMEKGKEWCDGYGWSQVVDEGWGVAYFLGEDGMQFNITSKGLGSQRFCEHLELAAWELRLLVDGRNSRL